MDKDTRFLFMDKCSIFNAQFSMLNVQCSMHNAQFSMLNVQCSMHNAQCSMFNAQCSMFNVQCSMLNVQCTNLISFYTKTILYSKIFKTKCTMIITYYKLYNELDKSTNSWCSLFKILVFFVVY
jgi:hypothetical protein